MCPAKITVHYIGARHSESQYEFPIQSCTSARPTDMTNKEARHALTVFFQSGFLAKWQ